MVETNLYKQTFEAAVKELSDLMKEREELDIRREDLNTRINNVRSGALALSSLIEEDTQDIKTKYPHLFPELIPADTGLTDAVRKVLKAKDDFLTPVGVRAELKATGYDISRYNNILASLHTILKRLVESDEVQAGAIGDATAYKWKKYRYNVIPPVR